MLTVQTAALFHDLRAINDILVKFWETERWWSWSNTTHANVNFTNSSDLRIPPSLSLCLCLALTEGYFGLMPCPVHQVNKTHYPLASLVIKASSYRGLLQNTKIVWMRYEYSSVYSNWRENGKNSIRFRAFPIFNCYMDRVQCTVTWVLAPSASPPTGSTSVKDIRIRIESSYNEEYWGFMVLKIRCDGIILYRSVCTFSSFGREFCRFTVLKGVYYSTLYSLLSATSDGLKVTYSPITPKPKGGHPRNDVGPKPWSYQGLDLGLH